MKQNVKQMFAILHSIIPVYAISLVDLQAALADSLMHETSHSIHLVCAIGATFGFLPFGNSWSASIYCWLSIWFQCEWCHSLHFSLECVGTINWPVMCNSHCSLNNSTTWKLHVLSVYWMIPVVPVYDLWCSIHTKNRHKYLVMCDFFLPLHDFLVALHDGQTRCIVNGSH